MLLSLRKAFESHTYGTCSMFENKIANSDANRDTRQSTVRCEYHCGKCSEGRILVKKEENHKQSNIFPFYTLNIKRFQGGKINDARGVFTLNNDSIAVNIILLHETCWIQEFSHSRPMKSNDILTYFQRNLNVGKYWFFSPRQLLQETIVNSWFPRAQNFNYHKVTELLFLAKEDLHSKPSCRTKHLMLYTKLFSYEVHYSIKLFPNIQIFMVFFLNYEILLHDFVN